ncbi:hypothetical protein [Arthrobacter sp. 2MCAF14]|uniref:hypothetical protein n=1 Tax=Arthrobacter sp. 2MCAF14 TaxID=3232982 RepID=UPI003F929D30
MVAKKDLLVIGIFTAILSCIGIFELMLRSGRLAVFVIPLLAAAGLYAAWRGWKRSRNVSPSPARHKSSPPKSRVGPLWANQRTLANRLVVLFVYIAGLCWAGVVVSGGTMATALLMSFAILATIGAVGSFVFRQKSRTPTGHG